MFRVWGLGFRVWVSLILNFSCAEWYTAMGVFHARGMGVLVALNPKPFHG